MRGCRICGCSLLSIRDCGVEGCTLDGVRYHDHCLGAYEREKHFCTLAGCYPEDEA